MLRAEDQHCADDGDEETPEAEPIEPHGSEQVEHEATHYGTDDSKEHVDDDAGARVVDDLAGDEACGQSEDDLCDDGHW